MMNVQQSTNFLFVYTAALAAISIALACLRGYPLPVGATISSQIAALPKRMRRANMVIRSPLACTFLVAELFFVVAYSIGLALDLITAGSTHNLDAGIVGSIFAFGLICLLPFTMTSPRTESIAVMPINLSQRSLISNTALKASERHESLAPFVIFEIAGMRTKDKLRSSNLPLGALEFDAATLTSLYVWFALHKKYLLLVIDRVLVEGIRTLTEGIARISEYLLPVNNYMPSTGVLYHKNGEIGN